MPEKRGKDIFKRIVGERIRLLREMNGLTQTELAHRLGYKGPQQLNNIEHGTRGMSKERIYKCAEILGVHPAVLLSNKEMGIEELEAHVDLHKIVNDPDNPNRTAVFQILKKMRE